MLPLLAALAGSLEFVSVVRAPPEFGMLAHITEAGVQAAMAAFAEHGGAPKIRFQ